MHVLPEEPEGRAPGVERERGRLRRGPKRRHAAQVGKQGELEGEGPGARERRNRGFTPGHPVSQVHRPVRDASGGGKGRQQPLAQVQGQGQQRPVVGRAAALEG